MGAVTCVLFDLDGVLIDFSVGGTPDWVFELVREEIEAHGGDPTVTRDAIGGLFAEPGADTFRQQCSTLGVSDPESFWAAIQSRGSRRKRDALETGAVSAYDGVEVLPELAADHELGIVSDQPRRSVVDVVEWFGWEEQFSALEGFTDLQSNDNRKPNPGHLTAALSTLQGSDGVYVGDNDRDVVAARRAGLRPILVERGPDRTETSHPVTRIDSLTELPTVLDAE